MICKSMCLAAVTFDSQNLGNYDKVALLGGYIMFVMSVTASMATVLEVDGVRMYPLENAKRHHTDRYELIHEAQNPSVILRRGQEFELLVKFRERGFDPSKDIVRLIFTFGANPSPVKGTRAVSSVTGRMDYSKDIQEWDVRLLKTDQVSVRLEDQRHRNRDTGTETQEQRHRIRDTGTGTQGHRIRDTGTETQNHGHRNRDTGTENQEQRHRNRDTGSETQEQGHRIRDTRSETQDKRHIIRDTESWTQEQRHRNREPGTETQDKIHRNRDTGSGTQDKRHRIRDTGSEAQDQRHKIRDTESGTLE
uniref:Transglutaminase N-terminal domain-containing protein n=1 Tax=Timema poppense TaxID=170557 RepID=A0A7R9DBY8_TIMPO|nr:unnamed protein product [Timema poppensis]